MIAFALVFTLFFIENGGAVDSQKMVRAPYFAHLEVESFYYGLLGKRSCGAVIIDDLWLATSAYCLTNAERAIVHMGSAREPNDTKIVGPTDLVVNVENTNFFQHPNYNRIMSWNDIGKFQYLLTEMIKISLI